MNQTIGCPNRQDAPKLSIENIKTEMNVLKNAISDVPVSSGVKIYYGLLLFLLFSNLCSIYICWIVSVTDKKPGYVAWPSDNDITKYQNGVMYVISYELLIITNIMSKVLTIMTSIDNNFAKVTTWIAPFIRVVNAVVIALAPDAIFGLVFTGISFIVEDVSCSVFIENEMGYKRGTSAIISMLTVIGSIICGFVWNIDIENILRILFWLTGITGILALVIRFFLERSNSVKTYRRYRATQRILKECKNIFNKYEAEQSEHEGTRPVEVSDGIPQCEEIEFDTINETTAFN